MISSIGTERLRVAIVVTGLLLARPCFAQNPTRAGTAQALFDEGTELFAHGDYDRACEKFRASDELDPKGGTLLNLALCREKQGRTGSAWTAFAEARNRSLKEHRDERVAFADKKLAELKPLLPRLRVVVADDLRALEIDVDGQVLPRAAWNTSVPIDPGEHVIDAKAPDRRPAKLTVRLMASEETRATIPMLTADPASSERPPIVVPHHTRWLGWTVLGAGVASLGVGSVFGVDALSKRSDAESLCAASRCDDGRRANDDGIRAGWIANVGIGLGLVAIGAGIYLLLRDRAAVPTAVH